MKSFRGTFIFTVVVIAACLFSYFEVFKKGNEDSEKKDKESQLYKLKAEEISQIELLKGEALIIMKKTGDNWALEKPVVDKVDQTSVKNFLDTVLREKTSDLVEEGAAVDFKTYGLDKPEFRLRFTGSGAKAIVEDVSFGSVKAYDGSVYSRFGEEKKVYLAPSYLSAVLNKKPSDFRNKNVFITSPADVDHLKVSGSEKVELERTKESWKLLAPQNYLAQVSPDSVMSYLNQFRDVKGSEIVADDKTDSTLVKSYHLDKPAVTVLAHRAQEPKDYELKISDPKADKDHNLYMMSSDTTSILKAVQSNLDAIDKGAFDFTDKHQAFTFGTVTAEEIRVSTADFKGFVKKLGNGWHNGDEADKREADTTKIDDLLGKFNHLEAKKLLKVEPKNLKNQIVISEAGGKEIFKMSWGEPIEEKSSSKEKSKSPPVKFVYVTTNKIKNVVTLMATQIDALALQTIFRNPDPIQFSGKGPKDIPNRPAAAALDQRNPTPTPQQEKTK